MKTENLESWRVWASQILDDVAVVTMVFVGFLSVTLLHQLLIFPIGMPPGVATFMAMLSSIALAAGLIGVWALWSRLVDWMFRRRDPQAIRSQGRAAAGAAKPALQVFLGSRTLPNLLIAIATVVGIVYLPGDEETFGWNFQVSFILFYVVVINLAPLRRGLVKRFVRPEADSATSLERSAIANVFE